MSKLFELANRVARRVLQPRSTLKVPLPPAPVPPGGMKSLPVAPPIVQRPLPPGGLQSRPGAPPVVSRPSEPAPNRNQPTPQEERDIKEVKETFDSIQLLGRDRGHSDEMETVMDGMRRVNSSNVYGYYFELEPGAKNSPSISSVTHGKQLAAYSGSATGILYVTFLGQGANASRSNSAGSTYAYYNVPVKKYGEFTHLADSSAGSAVWDYLRVRGTIAEHQHQYRLIQSSGDYVPRKATKHGLKTRHLLPTGQPKIPNSTWSAVSRLEHSRVAALREYGSRMKRELLAANQVRSSTHGSTSRATLQSRSSLNGRSSLIGRSGLPNRATPNRGAPNRG